MQQQTHKHNTTPNTSEQSWTETVTQHEGKVAYPSLSTSSPPAFLLARANEAHALTTVAAARCLVLLSIKEMPLQDTLSPIQATSITTNESARAEPPPRLLALGPRPSGPRRRSAWRRVEKKKPGLLLGSSNCSLHVLGVHGIQLTEGMRLLLEICEEPVGILFPPIAVSIRTASVAASHDTAAKRRRARHEGAPRKQAL